ncbi:hypothetical protein Afil01_59770 [Actinorhabdospora filicis]|uniref:DUF3566 domain-containing protein n=1 Tax=Actinorhabdospora filicis TaxID=1785913 RepID=A0A9W6WDT4_9ACTN|nr:DUF3566 domain-containing protein [Actinorhabdospora filicis]GLZ81170.1 hypothetical protein Afil01_59770 [Actinorhabdospora filicis]
MTDTQANGPAAVGRAHVGGPEVAETPSGKFTRPPGMTPPPTSPDALTPPSAPPTSSSAKVAEAVKAARQAVSAAAARGPRRARLHLKRIDPWSVMKFSFAVSLVLFIVLIVATTVLYIALDSMGVFTSLNELVGSLVGSDDGGEGFKFTARGVIGVSALLGVVNMVLFTAMATLGAFVYNVCADLVGGIELTLSEKE